MKRLYWVGIIIAIAIAVRILFASAYPKYQTTGDSVSYFLTGKFLVTEHRIHDPWRTPVYPLILALPYTLSGKPMPPVLNQLEFMPELWYIRIAQSAAGVCSFVLLFFLLIRLGYRDRYAGLFTLFMSVNPLFMLYELKLLTESFAMLVLLMALYITVTLMQSVSYKRFGALIVVLVILALLRPATILLPVLVPVILMWHHRNRMITVLSASTIAVYLVLIGGYIRSNDMMFNYRGISRISDVNLLGKINAYKLPVDGVKDEAGIGPYIRYIQTHDVSPEPWPIFFQRPDLYNSEYATAIHTFAADTIRRNLISYTFLSIAEIPRALRDMKPVTEQPGTPHPVNRIFTGLGRVFIHLQSINVLLFVAAPMVFISSIRKRTVRNSGLLLLVITGMYGILTATFLSYDDYTRLMIPTQPIMLFISLVTMKRLVTVIRKSK